MLHGPYSGLLISGAICFGAVGCTHSIHQYHVSDFEMGSAKGSKLIESRSEQFTVLGFVGDTQFVEKAYADLSSKCPNGRISAITTEHLTHHGFFSWTNEIIMTGRCVTR